MCAGKSQKTEIMEKGWKCNRWNSRELSDITGRVRNLCEAAKNACEELGYKTVVLTDQLDCQAREAGAFLGTIAKSHTGKIRRTDHHRCDRNKCE